MGLLDERLIRALNLITQHANQKRPSERPLNSEEDLNSVDIAICKAAARRLIGKKGT